MDKLEFSNANDMELNREDILFCQAKMLDEVCDAIIATDMDSDIVYWNEKAESTYGWTKEEALGQNVKSLLQSHYLCVSQEEPRRRLIMGKATSTECIHVCRHGSKINVMEKSSLMVDEKGTPVGFISMIWDITERKRMEELARRSEEVLRRNEERQAFLLKLNDQIHHLTNITLISQIATRLLTEHLGASRSSYSEINQQQFIIKRVIPMCRESVIHDIHLPEYSEEERSFYLSQNICACISVPIIKRYIPVANLTVIQDTPRNWLPEEVELVQETARRILESVERVRASEALLKVEREKNAALERSLALKEEFLSFVLRYVKLLLRSRLEWLWKLV
jgi:PAS domain S-box-containing protein